MGRFGFNIDEFRRGRETISMCMGTIQILCNIPVLVMSTDPQWIKQPLQNFIWAKQPFGYDLQLRAASNLLLFMTFHFQLKIRDILSPAFSRIALVVANAS